MNRFAMTLAIVSTSVLLMSTLGAATASQDQSDAADEADPSAESTDSGSAEPSPPRVIPREGAGAIRPGGLPRPVQTPRARQKLGDDSREGGQRRARGSDRPRVAACEEPPRPTGSHTFSSGESLVYDVDIMGLRAARLTLSVDEPAGEGPSFTASASTNTFFANIRAVEGRATSYTRDKSLYPIRYREDSTEDGVRKWSEVLFHDGRREVDVRFGIGQRERRVRYPVAHAPLDILSMVYYLRTLELSVGDEICLDVYATRRVWRVSGKVVGEEFIRTPAGGFETLLFSGNAQRLDRPNVERELHVWFANDESRTPVAAMSAIDLGPIRVRLSRTSGQPEPPRRRPDGGGRW